MLAIQLTPNPSKHSSPNNGGTALAAFLNGDAVSVFAYYFRPCQLRQILQSDIDSPLASWCFLGGPEGDWWFRIVGSASRGSYQMATCGSRNAHTPGRSGKCYTGDRNGHLHICAVLDL